MFFNGYCFSLLSITLGFYFAKDFFLGNLCWLNVDSLPLCSYCMAFDLSYLLWENFDMRWWEGEEREREERDGGWETKRERGENELKYRDAFMSCSAFFLWETFNCSAFEQTSQNDGIENWRFWPERRHWCLRLGAGMDDQFNFSSAGCEIVKSFQQIVGQFR